MIDLETSNTIDTRNAVKPAIKPGTKDHDLRNPVLQRLRYNIVNEACPSDRGGSRTWSSPVRVPGERNGEERNSAKNSDPAQRGPQKMDCEWIREEPPAVRTCRFHRTIKGHVLGGSAGSLRVHFRSAKKGAFGSSIADRVPS